MTGSRSPVEEYLVALVAQLRGPADRVRRMVAECEAHLAEATDAGLAKGLDRVAAERQAVARFGAPDVVAQAHNRGVWRRTMRQLLAPAGWEAARLVTMGLLAIGTSGPLAVALAALTGRAFVFAAPPTTRFPAAACAHWLHVQPTARSCWQAMLLENADDTLFQHATAGALGVLLLVALLVLWRRRPVSAVDGGLPAWLTPTFGATAFGLAGVALLALGVDRLVIAGGFGAGQWLVDATIALLVAVAYVSAILRAKATPADASPSGMAG